MRKALLVAGSCLFALVLAEGVLRVAGVEFSSSFYQLDLDRGWVLRPGAEGLQNREGRAYVRINRHGMRDRERSAGKPAGIYRVAVLGDSFAESLQVPIEQSFPALVEEKLGGCEALGGRRRAEVLNFGVTGYGTAQELLTYRMQVRDFDPDLVLLLFLTGNDIYNNHRYLNPTNNDAAPYFVIRDGQLALEKPFRAGGGPGSFWRSFREVYATKVRYSRLLQMGTEAFYNLQRRYTRDANRPVIDELGPAYLDRLIFSPPTHPALEEAWSVTEALLPVFHQEVTGDGRKFFLVVATNAIQVHPDADRREEFRRSIGARNLLYPDLRIQLACERAKIDHLLLAPLMLEEAERTKTYFHGFEGSLGTGHWNVHGHRFVADVLAREICGRVDPQ